MGWFSKSQDEKKKIRKSPELWLRCKACKKHIFKEDWHNQHSVCPQCNYHGRLTAYERIGITLDVGTFKEINEEIHPGDPLDFVDGKGKYSDRVEETRTKSGLNESIVTGTGSIEGKPVVVGVMDFRFLGGSLGSGTGEKILRAANYAYDHKLPLIIFSASGGARMHEGLLSLMQMAKTCAAVKRLATKNLPYISVLTDPTTGGVSASFAMVGDVHLAEPGALIGFAGRRVIEQTIKQKLPDDFQTSEYLLEHGFVDRIVQRGEIKHTLSLLLSFYNR